MTLEEKYRDAAAALRALISRLTMAEAGLSAAIITISTLVELLNEIDPDRMDQKLRELRVWTQASELGQVDSKLVAENKAQLKILETAMRRRVPPQAS